MGEARRRRAAQRKQRIEVEPLVEPVHYRRIELWVTVDEHRKILERMEQVKCTSDSVFAHEAMKLLLRMMDEQEKQEEQKNRLVILPEEMRAASERLRALRGDV